MEGDTGKISRALKWIALVVVLIVVSIIALPSLIDVNRFRPEIESRLTDALGREVKLGNLKFSLLSGSVKIDDITIADNPAFNTSPFLVSKSFQAGVELIPLILSREIRITGIFVDRPEIVLVRSSSGKWNFSDLGNPANGSRAARYRAARYRAASSNDSTGLSERAFAIRQVKITGGRVKLIDGKRKPSVYESVNLVVNDFSPSSSFPFTLAASLPGGGRLKLEGKAGPLNKTDTLLTPADARLDVTDLDLVASGFVTQDSGMSGIFDFEGTVTSDRGRAQSNGNAKAEDIQLIKGGTPAGKPISIGYTIDYDLVSHKGTLRSGEIQSGQAVARINGNFNRRGENFILNMRLQGVDMPVQDMESLLPAFGVTLPRGTSLEGGSLKVDLTAAGPVDRLVTAGTAEISGTRLTGFDMAGKMAALASLTGIQSSNITDIETLASGMRLTAEGIHVRDILLIMPELGRLTGSGRIEPDQSLDFAMRATLKPSGSLGTGLGRLLKRDTLNIPFFVRGTSSDPKFVLDAKNAAVGLFGSGLPSPDTEETQDQEGDGVRGILENLLRKKQ